MSCISMDTLSIQISMLPELKEPLRKYKENTCTAEDLARLRLYFSERKYMSPVKQSLHEELENFIPPEQVSLDVDFKRIFENIRLSINESPQPGVFSRPATRRKFVYLQILKVAAVVIPAILLGGVSSYFIFGVKQEKDIIAYNEIRAPYGARSEIVLPDGSTVWLNAGSSIKYMNVFNKTNRDVQLTGEGYFKVAKRTDLPFNVKTADLRIQALGTEFNVKSYDDEGIIETTLIEGKIAIYQNRRMKESIYLEPNQKAVYVKDNRRLTVDDLKTVKETKPEVLKIKKGIVYVADKIDPAPVVAWKENRLILKGEELNNLLIKLERKYNVTFSYQSENIKQFRFTGTLEDETLTQVLDVIKLSAPIDYILEGKEVKIYENQRMMERFNIHLKKK